MFQKMSKMLKTVPEMLNQAKFCTCVCECATAQNNFSCVDVDCTCASVCRNVVSAYTVCECVTSLNVNVYVNSIENQSITKGMCV